MVSGPLHLPTATWGGHMGQFLLSVLILSSSTPLGNTATLLRVTIFSANKPPQSFSSRELRLRHT